MYHCYILYSKTLDRYYIGSCGSDLEGRLSRHLSNHKGFTAKAKDWIVVHIEKYEFKTEALARERVIKRKKSRKYIERLAQLS